VSVDAHLLKWSLLVNLFGPRTSYELARVSGRYTTPDDEKTKVHTAYPLSYEKTLNMFQLRQMTLFYVFS